MAHSEEAILVLPISIASRVDVGRLLREVEALDSFLTQAAIRQSGENTKIPRTSRLLDDIIQTNKINPLIEVDRKRLLSFLMVVRKQAPLLHMSFSADPSPLFTQRLITWLRHEIHPLVLLQVGLQPNIGAGCVMRTTNKYFDFSLRNHFKSKREVLVAKIHGGMAP